MAVNIDKSILDEIAENVSMQERVQKSCNGLNYMAERQWYIDGIQYVLSKLGYTLQYRSDTDVYIDTLENVCVWNNRNRKAE